MDDKDIEYAVKTYQKRSGTEAYRYEDFLADIQAYIRNRPIPYNLYDPFSLQAEALRLWNVLGKTMRDIVAESTLDMAKFARRFCIPYRTLQAWCDGTNPCPIYIKLMIAEILKMYTRTVWFHDISGYKKGEQGLE